MKEDTLWLLWEQERDWLVSVITSIYERFFKDHPGDRKVECVDWDKLMGKVVKLRWVREDGKYRGFNYDSAGEPGRLEEIYCFYGSNGEDELPKYYMKLYTAWRLKAWVVVVENKEKEYQNSLVN